MAKLSYKNRNALRSSEGFQFICHTHNWQSAVYDTEEEGKIELFKHLKKFPQPHDLEMAHEQKSRKPYKIK